MATPEGRRQGCILIVTFTAVAWIAIVLIGAKLWNARHATPRETTVQRCIASADGAPSRVAECWSKR